MSRNHTDLSQVRHRAQAQGLPNAVNTPAFPPVLCAPDRPYRQITTVEIAPEGSRG